MDRGDQQRFRDEGGKAIDVEVNDKLLLMDPRVKQMLMPKQGRL